MLYASDNRGSVDEKENIISLLIDRGAHINCKNEQVILYTMYIEYAMYEIGWNDPFIVCSITKTYINCYDHY